MAVIKAQHTHDLHHRDHVQREHQSQRKEYVERPIEPVAITAQNKGAQCGNHHAEGNGSNRNEQAIAIGLENIAVFPDLGEIFPMQLCWQREGHVQRLLLRFERIENYN